MVSIFVEKIEERPEKVLVEEEKKKETKRKKEKKEEKEKEEKREERMAGSTHNAFKVKQLLVDRLPETIESIETFDNYLIAGLLFSFYFYFYFFSFFFSFFSFI